MIAFQVAPSTYRALTRWSRRIFTALFVVTAAWLMASAGAGYLRANTILRDHGVVVVPVSQTVDARASDGEHHFAYRFAVQGKCYRGGFLASNADASQYLDPAATVQIAYANTDPARFERLDRLRSEGETGSVLTRLAVEVPAAGVLMYLLHLALTRLFVGRLPGGP